MKACIDCGKPLTRGGRYKRCKSHAALHRWQNSTEYQAKRRQELKAAARLHSEIYACQRIEADAIRWLVRERCLSLINIDRFMGWPDRTLAHALARGRLSVRRTAQLAAFLGRGYEELVA